MKNKFGYHGKLNKKQQLKEMELSHEHIQTLKKQLSDPAFQKKLWKEKEKKKWVTEAVEVNSGWKYPGWNYSGNPSGFSTWWGQKPKKPKHKKVKRAKPIEYLF